MKRLTKSQYEIVGISLHNSIALLKWGKVDAQQAEAVAHQMATDLANYDNQFDKKKFLKLCGIED